MAGRNRLDLDKVKKDLLGRNIVLLSEIYVKAHDMTRFECKICQTTWQTKLYCVRNNGTGCPNCGKKKQVKTCRECYGIRYNKIIDKTKITNIIKYGFACSFKNENVKRKFKENSIKKYGVDSPTKSEIVKNNNKKILLERYGVDNVRKLDSVKDKIRVNNEKTCLKRYGVKNIFQDAAVVSKIIKKRAISCNNSGIIKYWKTDEEFIWKAGYEKAFLQWVNKNQIEILWQIRFETPILTKNGNISFYFIDAYLPEKNLYIEIKGYHRPDAKSKWEWFHQTYPNSELWDKNKLKELGIL